VNDKATETIKAAAANIGRAFQALGKDFDAERIEAGDIRKAQFSPAYHAAPSIMLTDEVIGFECDHCHRFNEVDKLDDAFLVALEARFGKSGTIPPETAPDAPDGPEIPSRSAISDEDRASIRKISDKLFGSGPFTAFEQMVADGVRECERIRELTADRDAERDRAKGLATLLERAQDRYDESRELLAQAGIKLVEREKEIDGLLAQIATADDHGEQFHDRITSLTAKVAERDAIIKARDGTIEGMHGVVMDRDRDLASLQDRLAARDAQIERMHSHALDRSNDIGHLTSRIEARDRLLDRILELVIDAKGGK